MLSVPDNPYRTADPDTLPHDLRGGFGCIPEYDEDELLAKLETANARIAELHGVIRRMSGNNNDLVHVLTRAYLMIYTSDNPIIASVAAECRTMLVANGVKVPLVGGEQ